MMLPDKTAAYGEVPEHFRRLVAGALQEEAKPMKRKSMTLILITALLMVVLAATALAIGLNRTPEYSAAREASQVLSEKYGLSDETLGLHSGWTEDEGDLWVVTFTPIKYEDRLGTYIVMLAKDGSNKKAMWTHDGVDLKALEAEGLNSTVWGHAQVAQYIALSEVHLQKTREMYGVGKNSDWSFEKQAELDAMLLEAGVPGWFCVLPGEGDISKEEAIEQAKETAMALYGVTREKLEEYSVNMSLMRSAESPEAIYTITFTAEDGMWTPEMGYITVSMRAQSGEVESYYWSVDAAYRTLPDGPLDEYEEAVKEFVDLGAFGALPYEQKAEVGARIEAAGFGALLDGFSYTTPSEEDMAEADVLAIGADALAERYGLTEAMLGLFETTVSRAQTEEQDMWRIEWKPKRGDTRPLLRLEAELGSYHCAVSATDGEVLDAQWSHDGVTQSDLTQTTWGQAKAYDADILPWYLELMEKQEAVMAEYFVPDIGMSIEGVATWQQLFRDVGFDANDYPMGMPGEGDLTEKQILDIAKLLLMEEYGMPESVWENARIWKEFYVTQPKRWRLVVMPQEGQREDFYVMYIDAVTGDVMEARYIAQGNG